jgi:dihydropteroate synthase
MSAAYPFTLRTPGPTASLTLRTRTFDLSRKVAVMAIVNRTPDSFYDQGATYELDTAIDHAMGQVAAGADIIDVGGVKAGPGDCVDRDEEMDRVLPFVEAFRSRCDVPVSVDTFRASVAAAALDAGADIVNDVSGMVEPDVADVVAARPGTALVVMHPGGPVRTRPYRSTYDPDVTTEVVTFCAEVCVEAQRRGVPREALVVDPGHDFGKNTYHSLELTRRLDELAALGYPVLVAVSNKDFLGETLGAGLNERLEASLACAVVAIMQGASIVRVHHTRATVRAVRTVEAILGWRQPAAPARGLE